MAGDPPADAAVDPVLLPFLRASGEEAERCLADLIGGNTDRAIRAIVSRTLGGGYPGRGHALDAADVRADVIVQLLGRLRQAQSRRGESAIENFAAYVASVAYRTCYTHLRRLHPQRARLKNRLRYTLTYSADFTIELDPLGIWRCGLTAWQTAAPFAPRLADIGGEDAVQRFRREPAAFARDSVPDPAGERYGLGEAVRALLTRVGEPVDLDLLVDAVGGLLGIADRAPVRTSGSGEDGMPEIADPKASVAETLADRQYLARLWREVRELPLNQRFAVLLNLRDDDGGSALPLLPLTGIATIRQIAEALEMPALELAALWSGLPLEDARIAARLGLTRQQIINLRKSARQRLGRRMVHYAAGNTDAE